MVKNKRTRRAHRPTDTDVRTSNMASPSSLLSEEQLLCSICLHVFSQPASIPCGHNFCMACITQYWDSIGHWLCPLCNRSFEQRPDLFVNTLISEMVVQMKTSAEMKAQSSQCLDQDIPKPGEVPCDVCPENKVKALKTCLVCLASYCKAHLEPHHTVAALKRHKLVEPVKNLEDRMCKKHSKFFELFCRTDQLCICIMCSQTAHKTHDTVSLAEAYKEKKPKLRKQKREMQNLVQERLQKVQEIKQSAAVHKMESEKEKSDGIEVLTSLVSYIQTKQAEFIEAIEDKQKAADTEAGAFVTELEQEVAVLQGRSTELEKLSLTEDHLQFLQIFPTLSSPPATKDWSKVSVRSYLPVGTVKTATARLQEALRKEMETMLRQMQFDAIKLKGIRELYLMNVILDPDTAYPNLVLSADRRGVQAGPYRYYVFYTYKCFTKLGYVLGKQGFSRRFYYEVQVKGKTSWILGVARQSVNRNIKVTGTPEEGFWTISLSGGQLYAVLNNSSLCLPVTEEPQKVGVFVDYDEGEVSFYDVEASALIYTFNRCTFTEKLYPVLCPGCYGAGNSAPMIITPGKSAWSSWTLVLKFWTWLLKL